MKPKREFNSLPLALFVLWSFFMIFVHNKIQIVPGNFMNQWLNMSIMFEGFIYILFGYLFIRNIVIYSSNLKFIFLLLPFALIPTIKIYTIGGQMTIYMALILSVIIYLFLKRKNTIAIILSIMSATEVIGLWPYVVKKFSCRPVVWHQLFLEIHKHPFIGSGFNHTLQPNNMIWVNYIGNVNYGWIFRHNDLLSIGAYLGAVVILFLVWFIAESLVRIGKTIYIIPFLTIALASFFQLILFDPVKGAICLTLIGVCLKETYKGEKA